MAIKRATEQVLVLIWSSVIKLPVKTGILSGYQYFCPVTVCSWVCKVKSYVSSVGKKALITHGSWGVFSSKEDFLA